MPAPARLPYFLLCNSLPGLLDAQQVEETLGPMCGTQALRATHKTVQGKAQCLAME